VKWQSGGVEADHSPLSNGAQLFKAWWILFFLYDEGPRSRCYGSTTALRLFVQPCDEDEQFSLPSFTSNGATVE
jgi:hypothetical protein